MTGKTIDTYSAKECIDAIAGISHGLDSQKLKLISERLRVLIAPLDGEHQVFGDAVKPAMKWLAENKDPHCKIIIESDCAELVLGELCFRTDEFIKD